MKPLVSIVMATYNSEQFISESINSILSQSYSDFEFIIVDDGSVDHTIDKIKTFKDSRIRIFENIANKGNYTRRNEGCKLANGKYIAIMDADDIAFPDRLEKQIGILEADDKLLALGTFFQYINGPIMTKPINYDYVKLALLFNNVFLHPSLVIRNSILQQVNYYDIDYYYSADYNLACKIAIKGRIENIPEVLMMYRYHENQISTAHHQDQKKYANIIRLEYLSDLGFVLSDTEKDLFNLIMTNSNDTSISFEVTRYLREKLLSQNIEKNIFNQSILENFLKFYMI